MVDTRKIPEMKPLLKERLQILLGKDFEEYQKILKIPPVNSIRCNTLKISPKELKEKLESKGWKINQPWKEYPEVMIIESLLEPGELGRALEHLLGYYYVQELASMLPIISLNLQPNEFFLDLCASPGSKTTQAAAKMQNSGNIIANEVALSRIRILASNLERCGVTNTIITRKDGVAFSKRITNLAPDIKFDKILVDAPCSGEGTLRSTYKTYQMWNINTIKALSILQKQLFREAFKILKVGGEIIYSTCTHAPEENEQVVSEILKEFQDSIEILPTNLPIQTREGLTEWQGEKFNTKVKLCSRIYPQDNNTEGFFVSKFKKIK
jgi:NOL1/NOP2/sun family putative RNA methylase